MHRLLLLLLLFALAVSNSAAIAGVMCGHVDAEAHSAARESADAGTAQAALSEETKSKAVGKTGALSDSAAAALAGYALPPEGPALAVRIPAPAARLSWAALVLAGRSLRPILEPPLA